MQASGCALGQTMTRGVAATARVGLTLGDPTGIGPEVIFRALRSTTVLDQVQWLLFCPEPLRNWLLQSIESSGLSRWLVEGSSEGPGLVARFVAVGGDMKATWPSPGQPNPVCDRLAYEALLAMVLSASGGDLQAMVTGPVTKGIFDHLDSRPPGQTEFVARHLAADRHAMMLAGPVLRVVPVTTHMPLREVADLVHPGLIIEATMAAVGDLRAWFSIANPKVAVCGLNPHAGEGGRLGDEDVRVVAPAVAALVESGLDVVGPVSADTVFHDALQGRFDLVVCMYHDQALGPLKTVHFHDAFNMTCGLPVPRLSPSHGTAHDIAGHGVADVRSATRVVELATDIALAKLEGHRRQGDGLASFAEA